MSCLGQDRIDSLVRLGIQFHDDGEFEKAIAVYKEALRIDPKSTIVNYEISMTYRQSGESRKAIRHSNIVIRQKKEDLLLAYISKGSALCDMGKTKKAIKLYKKAIAKYGADHLIYYNLGVSYLRLKDYKNAELAYINEITTNPTHKSSHHGLAVLKSIQHQKVQSLLSLYFFLLLEPASMRAEIAYTLLKQQLEGNFQKDDENNEIKNPLNEESEFAPVELMLEMIKMSNSLEINKDKTPEELFIDNTKAFFLVLGELSEVEKKDNIWWNFYVPFFYDLAQSEYLDVFCYFISISSNKKAKEWIESNDERFNAFMNWLND